MAGFHDLIKALQAALAPVRTDPVKELTVSIAGGGKAEFTVESREKYSALVVAVKAEYDPAATAGVRVRWLYSPDNVNFDSEQDAEDAGNYEDLTFVAGETRQRTIVIPIVKPYVKAQIINRDTTYAVIVTAWRTLLR